MTIRRHWPRRVGGSNSNPHRKAALQIRVRRLGDYLAGRCTRVRHDSEWQLKRGKLQTGEAVGTCEWAEKVGETISHYDALPA